MREGFVLVNLNETQSLGGRKSLWRAWNQLSRLQRNVITAVLLGLLFLFLYYFKGPTYSTEPSNHPIHKYETLQLVTPLPWAEKEKEEEELSAPHHVDPLDVPKRRSPLRDEEKSVGQAPPRSINVLPSPDNLTFVQEPLLPFPVPSTQTERQKAVVAAFKHAWAGYKKFAWGHDNLKPISRKPHNWFKLGLTIVDSLDTMYLMGLNDELKESRDWVANGLQLDVHSDVNLFEVTIRVLGGLLSAYHLTTDKIYLEKAKDLGERLMPCFTRSPSPIPYSDVNLATHIAHSPRWSPDSSTSEVTTIQLEFRDLSRVSGDPKFEDAASKASEHVHTLAKTDGLVPVFINPRTGSFQLNSDIKLGARGDSYYEYLLKQWIQTGKTIDYLKNDYLEAVAGVQKHLMKQTVNSKLTYIGELKGGTRDFVPKMDHLVCYFPGTLALGYHHGLPSEHLDLAQRLLYTCYQTYVERPTFLAPEITYFGYGDDAWLGDMYVKSSDAHNLLRPEFLESLWYMYQITGNKTFQDWGWTIFESIQKYTKVAHGYTSISDVTNVKNTKPKDFMESFFLSETLKYLFLLFADDRRLLDVDKFVVNTEGHPLPAYLS